MLYEKSKPMPPYSGKKHVYHLDIIYSVDKTDEHTNVISWYKWEKKKVLLLQGFANCNFTANF